MPTKIREKLLCVEALRHSEYYDMQATFDNLYARSSAGEKFTGLIRLEVWNLQRQCLYKSGTVLLLRQLVNGGYCTKKEATRIAAKIARQMGADIKLPIS